jgi:hypothetical protein
LISKNSHCSDLLKDCCVPRPVFECIYSCTILALKQP